MRVMLVGEVILDETCGGQLPFHRNAGLPECQGVNTVDVLSNFTIFYFKSCCRKLK